MTRQRIDNTIKVGVAAGNRGVDVLCQPRTPRAMTAIPPMIIAG